MQPQGTSLLYFSSSLVGSLSLSAQPVEADSGLIKSTSLAVRASPRELGFVDLSPIPLSIRCFFSDGMGPQAFTFIQTEV